MIGFRYEKAGECYAGISHLSLESRVEQLARDFGRVYHELLADASRQSV